jgi:glycine/D-amino acid oxidase-like deaminating enzyme
MMNRTSVAVPAESGRSPWLDTLPDVDARPLSADERCDVLVVGSGIAGISVAYELAAKGRDVIVIDRGRIGSGVTARTAGHLTSLLDEYYFELVGDYGADEARRRHAGQVAAIDRIEQICAEERIDADFRRVDGFLFAPDDDGRRHLREEHDACRKLGIPALWSEEGPEGLAPTWRCLRFPGQARFHPTRYLAGLTRAISANGGRFHADTAYAGSRETESGVEIETAGGARIFAGATVLAVNPPGGGIVTAAGRAPMRTCAIAGRVPKGSVADALMWDTLKAYHYARIQPCGEDADLLIVGGEDHRSSDSSAVAARVGALEAWARLHFPSFGQVEYAWSGAVPAAGDLATYSGRNAGARNIYTNFANSGQGITRSVLGALAILRMLLA